MGDLQSQRWAAVADAHLPSISRNLKRIADALEKENDPLQDPAVQGLLARLEDFELGLELCLAEGSPLPPLAKDVVRGFFISVLPPPNDGCWCETCGGEGVIDGEVCPHCDCGEG